MTDLATESKCHGAAHDQSQAQGSGSRYEKAGGAGRMRLPFTKKQVQTSTYLASSDPLCSDLNLNVQLSITKALRFMNNGST